MYQVNKKFQVKDIYLYLKPFSVGNDLLTPALKNKRVKWVKHFDKKLTALYSKL